MKRIANKLTVMPSNFSTFNEKPLHAALKQWYAGPDDQFEQPVGRYIIDIVQPHQLVEIQTRSFSSMKSKLLDLVENYPVRLVHPIAQEKWVVKLAEDGVSEQSRRKSPKHGTLLHLFGELVSFPALLNHPNFSLEVLLIREEEVRRHEVGKAWRRGGWVTHERRLLGVVEQRVFKSASDFFTLLPEELGDFFTSADLAATAKCQRRLAQQMIFCLRELGVIKEVRKLGRAKLYEQTG